MEKILMKRLLLLGLLIISGHLLAMEKENPVENPIKPLKSRVVPSLKFLTAYALGQQNPSEKDVDLTSLSPEIMPIFEVGQENLQTDSIEEITQSILSKACFTGTLTENLLQELYALNPDLKLSGLPIPERSPLHLAAVKGHLNTVALLLKHGAPIDDREGYDKRTPLLTVVYAAKEENRLKTLQFLLKNGASIEAHDTCGRTALYHAVERELFEETKLLLQYKASVNCQDKWGNSALYQAINTKNTALMQLLIEHGATIDPQHDFEKCVREKFREGIQLFVKNGVDINMRLDSMTALQHAILYNNFSFAQFLLSFGADPNALSSDNETALIFAIRQENTAMVKLLLEHGANANVTGRYFDYALCIALNREAFEVASLLLDYGAQLPEHCDKELGVVIAECNTPLLKRLLDGGAYESTLRHEYIRQTLIQKTQDPAMRTFIENYHQERVYAQSPWFQKKLIDAKHFIKDHKKAIAITGATAAVGAGIWYWLKNKEK